jgi:hypothetical protein
VGFAMQLPMIVLALLAIGFGVYYRWPLLAFIYPGIGAEAAPLGIWSSGWATGLIVVGLLVGLVIYALGRYRKSARVVAPFTGGEELDQETGRVMGTRFYDTIRSMPVLKGIYGAQEKGRLDPAAWIGAAGLGFTAGLRRIHNGLLSWYLSWSLFGIVLLLLLLTLLR